VTQVIEAYNYRIGIDATGVTSGTALTRREINQIRSTFRSLTAPADQASQRIDLLTRAFKQGAVDRVNYNSAVAQLSAKLPANVAATEALASAQAKAAAIQRSLITEEQQYRSELTATMQAVRDGGLSREQAAEHLRAYKASLPSAIAEEQRLTAAQREAASIMRANATDSERYRAEVLRVKEAVTIGGLSHEAAKRQLDAFRATLGPAIAQQRELAAAQATAAAIQRDGMSDAQRYAAEQARVEQAVKLAGLSHVDAQRHLDQFKASLPGAVAEQQRLADAQSKMAAIQREGMSDAQRYAAEQADVEQAVKLAGLSHVDAQRHLEQFKASLPGAIDEQRRLAEAQREVEAITQEGMTDAQRYGAEQARVARLVRDHGLAEAEAARHLERYRQTLPSVVAAEQQRTAAMQRADAMTEKYMRSTDRLANEIREINQLERAGSIDQRTAGLARRDARRTAMAGRLGEMAGVPGLGGMAGQAGQLLAMSGPLAAVAGGVIAVTVAFKAASAAASAFAAAMQEDAVAIQKVYHSATLLRTSVDSLIAFQYAAQQTVGMNADESLNVLTKLSTKIAEAAAGGGEAKAVLDSLNIDAVALSTQDPAEAMKVLADRVAAVKDPLQQAYIGMKLFEEEGTKLATVMRSGAAGLQAAEDRARELGLVISNVDASGISGSLDAMTDVQMVVTGIVRQFNTGFYPAVTAISTELTAWLQPLTDSRGVGETVGMTLVGVLGITTDIVAATVAFHRVLWNVATFDFSEAAEQLESMNAHMQGSTTNSLAQRWYDAQDAAAKAAEEMERNAEIEKQSQAEASKSAKIHEHLQKLRDQVKDTVEGTTAADREAQTLMAGNAAALEEERKLREQIAQQKRDAEVGNALKAADDELATMRAIAEAKRQGIDEQTARERINLQVLGAGDAELQRHLATRREIVAMQQRATAETKRQQEAEKLAQDAKAIKDSQRKPEQVLGEEFRRLQEMRDADLLSEAEYQRARAEAAKNAKIEKPSAAAPEASEFGVESYKRLVAQEAAQREQQIEDDRTARLIAAADKVAAAETRRLEVQQQITAQLERQSQLTVSSTTGTVPTAPFVMPDPASIPPVNPRPIGQQTSHVYLAPQALDRLLATQVSSDRQLASQTAIAGRGPEGGLDKLPITQPGMKAELSEVIAVLNRVAVAQEEAVTLLRELEPARSV
jgi:hypothetical protein